MARYDRGIDRGYGPTGGGWADPWGGMPGGRGRGAGRPWTGGYRGGYQGGSGGIRTTGARSTPYGRDYWWLGEREMERQGRFGSYDQAYRDFDRQNRPRFSPVGGTYAAMGGQSMYRRPPRPLRDDTWFSDWTRWF